ncbi:MAG: cell division protein SepF [Candidatus ainarchaeum sp.]|nr:cell division protein SepF [Candidatus ainarchaeum sp.]
MGFFDNILGGGEEKSDLNLEDVIEGEGDVINPPADFYVKKIDVRNEGDVELIAKELTSKNVIILNVSPLSKQPNRLKKIIARMKEYSDKIDGDIALLSSDLVILTPKHVKIVKSKPTVKK